MQKTRKCKCSCVYFISHKVTSLSTIHLHTHRGFIPSPGHLKHLVPPPTSPTIRVDTGVRQGDHVTTYYDPMIAKLVVWGADRQSALKKLRASLNLYQVIIHMPWSYDCHMT